jgi:hypothetical protein
VLMLAAPHRLAVPDQDQFAHLGVPPRSRVR